MTMQKYETVDVVLEEPLTEKCGRTKGTSNHIWQCVAPEHLNEKHYFQNTASL